MRIVQIRVQAIVPVSLPVWKFWLAQIPYNHLIDHNGIVAYTWHVL
jgi:hypothetical protein